MTGETGSANFPTAGPPLQAKYGGGETDIFVAKLSPVGAYIWARRAGGPWNSDQGLAVAADLNGNVVAVGIFQASADFGGGAMTSPSEDGFIVEFAP